VIRVVNKLAVRRAARAVAAVNKVAVVSKVAAAAVAVAVN
jgi:hypothetical protein